MSATTEDFNAWLAQEGAKVGINPPARQTNYLRDVYGEGYLPANVSDTAEPDPTTASVLANMDARYSGPGGYLRSLRDQIPESPNTLSILNMGRSGLNTMANWLQNSPEIGPDTLAPLGMAAIPGAWLRTGRTLVGAERDAAIANRLMREFPDEVPVTGGGLSRLATANAEGVLPPDGIIPTINNSSKGLGAKTRASQPLDEGYDAIHELANDWSYPLDASTRRLYDESLARQARRNFEVVPGDLLSDQSKSSLPGTIVNSMGLERQGAFGKNPNMKLRNVEEWKDGFGETHRTLIIANRPVDGISEQRLAIDPDGTVVMEYPAKTSWGAEGSLSDPGPRLFRQVEELLHPYGEDVFVRSALRKEDYDHLVSGKHRGSKNHDTGEEEGGLSVSREPEAAGYQYAYLVRGKVIGQGADGEPLLDLASVKPISKPMNYAKMVMKYGKDRDENALKKWGLDREEVKLLRLMPSLDKNLKASASNRGSPPPSGPRDAAAGALPERGMSQQEYAAWLDDQIKSLR